MYTGLYIMIGLASVGAVFLGMMKLADRTEKKQNEQGFCKL